MNDSVSPASIVPVRTENFDVLIVGAGISGIGGAYHLQQQCPDKSYVILEMQDTFGGTWWTHKYPGIRSDSDLHTFGYRFKPWTTAPIASADEIRKYMGEVIEENHIDQHIRYHHKVLRAEWSEVAKTWTLDARQTETGEMVRFVGNFLWMCQGYYRHETGYTPEWPGMKDFKGEIVHPQTWPENYDYTGKRVVVIGSGATAATLIPAMAPKVGHLTMLQRSPTFFRTGRNAIPLAEELRMLQVDEHWIHEIVRRKILYEQAIFTKRAESEPEKVKQELLAGVKHYLGDAFDIDKHFTPTSAPFTQRVCLVPDGDFFEAIKAGKASVVTDEIERFTPEGILLKSGEVLEADVIITATGFNLNVLGDIDFTIDNRPLDMAQTINYRGMMFTGVPNLIWVFGYFRASWTLRVDLIGRFVTRLLNHMDDKGYHRVEPALRPEDADLELGPWVDPDDFNPGYLNRGMHLMPKAGAKREWRHSQDYWSEKEEIPALDLEDPAFAYA